MIGIGLSPVLLATSGQAGDGADYSNETTALVAAMSVRPSEARIAQIETLVAALKSAGVWSKLDILYVLAAHDAQAARLNWKAPGTFTLVEVNSPTFTTDRGYAGNGTTSYLNTQFTPSTNGVNLQQDSATIGVWCRTSAVQAGGLFGNGAGTGSLVLAPRITGDTFNYRVNQGTTVATASTDGSGHFAASRSGGSATQGYKTGATAGAAGAIASGALTAQPLNIGRVAAGFSAAQAAAAYAGANLSGTEHGNAHTALSTYMTAVGA